MPIMRVITPLLAAVVLIACANPSATVPADPSPTLDAPAKSVPSEKLAEVVAEPLPEVIQDQVRAAHAEYRNLSVEQVRVVRHSRETWSDGCLGLGGPAESCLAALTEGWQVEVTDPKGGSTFYRTDLTGNSIRRSTLESNLPPSVGDRILHTFRPSGLSNLDAASIVDAEPQLWDGCYGITPLPTSGEACPEVGILGWRAIVTDGQRYWVYHTDALGNVMRLNETASGTTAVPRFIDRLDRQDMGDETLFQEVRTGEAQREIVMLEGDGQLFHHLQSRDLEQPEPKTETKRYQVAAGQVQSFSNALNAIPLEHLDGLAYGMVSDTPTGEDRQIQLQTWRGVVQYIEGTEGLPQTLAGLNQDWAGLLRSQRLETAS